MWLSPVELSAPQASLVPLSMAHCDALSEGVAEGNLHQLWYTMIPAPEVMAQEIERRLDLQAQGRMVPFTVLDADGQAVGMTTFMDIDARNKRVEIGSTWYRPSVQRSGLNTTCKFLLLRHAFEEREAIAVEFRTHVMNRQSRRAIERLGAKQDGVLRSHMVMANGTLRDTAVYSITSPEWPAVRANLEHMRTVHHG